MGWGVIEGRGTRFTALGQGVLRAPPAKSIALRLKLLAEGLRAVIAEYRPQEAALEEVFYGKDVGAAVRIGEGRGAALLVLAEADVPVTGYANNVVKKSVTGGGRADKERVWAMLSRVLALSTRPETLDASDALALALCHHQRRGLGEVHEQGGRRALPGRVARALAHEAKRPLTAAQARIQALRANRL